MLYTKYVYYFQGAGLILLVAMIGAIVLTLRHKEGVEAPVDRGAGGARQGDGDGRRQVAPGDGRRCPRGMADCRPAAAAWGR